MCAMEAAICAEDAAMCAMDAAICECADNRRIEHAVTMCAKAAL